MQLAAAFGQPRWRQPAFIVIWTTTAWTIPANQALNVHPELEYAWSIPRAACCSSPVRWSEKCLNAGLPAGGARHRLEKARSHALPHPLAHVDKA